MIERVARAIVQAGFDSIESTGEAIVRDMARAAIAAMREPTKGMIDAAMATIPEPSPSWRTAKRIALRQQFPVMIDAALK